MNSESIVGPRVCFEYLPVVIS